MTMIQITPWTFPPFHRLCMDPTQMTLQRLFANSGMVGAARPLEAGQVYFSFCLKFSNKRLEVNNKGSQNLIRTHGKSDQI
jgi:hypothetical protein